MPVDYLEAVSETEAAESGAALHTESASEAGASAPGALQLNGSASSLTLNHGQTQPQRAPALPDTHTHTQQSSALFVSEDESVTINTRISTVAPATLQTDMGPSMLSSLHASTPTAEMKPPRDTVSSQAHSHTGGIVESFMKNEVYFRSLMKQRQETFLRLDSCISDTAQEISSCKAKNSLLAKKIRELDNMIEEDRAKWRGRIDEEKRLLSSQASGALKREG